MLRTSGCVATLVGCVVMIGCADPNAKLEPQDPTATKESKEYVPTAAAGVTKDISKSEAVGRYRPYILSTSRFGHRSNPFALNSEEQAFDRAQAAEKIVIDGGAFGSLYTLPDDKLDVAQPVEPQPYRRLSGILIGDSVLAILEEGGKSTIVRPGMLSQARTGELFQSTAIRRSCDVKAIDFQKKLKFDLKSGFRLLLPGQGRDLGQARVPVVERLVQVLVIMAALQARVRVYSS
jgi:hypothetical protein